MCNKRLGKLLGAAVCMSVLTGMLVGCGKAKDEPVAAKEAETVAEASIEATVEEVAEEAEEAVTDSTEIATEEATEEYVEEPVTEDVTITYSEPPFSYYADTYLKTCKVGTFHMDENGKMLIRQGEFGTNEEGSNSVMLYIEGAEELTYELTDDVYINVFYPIDYVNGTQITGEEFLNYLKDYSIDCYYHLTDDGRIDAILGEYYA